MNTILHLTRSILAIVACALLASCGGGSEGSGDAQASVALPFVAQMRALASSSTTADGPGAATTTATAATPVSADRVLDWAEFKFPDLFPKAVAQRFPAVVYEGVTYNARAYSGAWGTRYLGITPDGRVFGLGDFTNQMLQAFETVTYWSAQVSADACAVYPGTCALAPTISAQPQSRSAAVGQTATFSVTAAGAASLSYQWQRNGIDIGGATSASYTTPTLGLADSGVRYTVRVSNAGGSVTSAQALLTVTASTGQFGSLSVTGTGVPAGYAFVPTAAVPRGGVIPVIWAAQGGFFQLNVTMWAQGGAFTGVSVVASPGTLGGQFGVNLNCNVGGTAQGCNFAALRIYADTEARTLTFDNSPLATGVSVSGTLRW